MAKGEGSFEQVREGVWRLRLTNGRDGAGKKLRSCHTIYATSKRDAERQRRQILHQRDTGQYQAPSRMTLEAYMAQWLESVSASLERKTHQNYSNLLRLHVIPRIGKLKLVDVTTLALGSLYADLSEDGARMDGKEGGLSPATIRTVHAVLSAGLQAAVDSGMLVRNPASRASLPKAKAPQIVVLTAQEVDTLLASCTGYLRPAVILAVGLGLRRGEVLALRWEDVDLDAGTVYVRRSLIDIKGAYITKTTKTDRERMLIMPEFVSREMAAQKQKQREHFAELGICEPNAWNVCTIQQGLPMLPSYLSHNWRKLIVGLEEVRTVRFHDLRHSCATWLVSLNVPLPIIQLIMGHSDIRTTMRYVHLSAEATRKGAAALDGHIGQLLKNRQASGHILDTRPTLEVEEEAS